MDGVERSDISISPDFCWMESSGRAVDTWCLALPLSFSEDDAEMNDLVLVEADEFGMVSDWKLTVASCNFFKLRRALLLAL